MAPTKTRNEMQSVLHEHCFYCFVLFVLSVQFFFIIPLEGFRKMVLVQWNGGLKKALNLTVDISKKDRDLPVFEDSKNER